jgi:hypothetical protein
VHLFTVTYISQIADWISAICEALAVISPDLVATCSLVLHAEIPLIIENILNGNFSPDQVCQKIGYCLASPPFAFLLE